MGEKKGGGGLREGGGGAGEEGEVGEGEEEYSNRRYSEKSQSHHQLTSFLPHWPCLTSLHRRHLKTLRE